MNDDEKVRSLLTNTINGVKKAVKVSEFNFFNLFVRNLMCISNLLFILLFASSDILVPKMYFCIQRDLMAQRLARRAEDREVPGSSPTQD